MMHYLQFAACAALVASADTAPPTAGDGPEPREICIEPPEESAPDDASWHQRLGDWLRRDRPNDGYGRAGYYLRSPLLNAVRSAAERRGAEVDEAEERACLPPRHGDDTDVTLERRRTTQKCWAG